MCTLQLTQTVASLVSEGELAQFLICTLLTIACLVSVGELASFLMCTLLVTQVWPVLFQDVSLPRY
ncbi:hypothetical protein K443DRAFT_666491 [Laccaria amethystina LaAM-08-1]|uniref:Uncharacterized protein n=1 Tax=Laccaria amethystina LaAM-08-1 TaxID=1095629 RepID=A0A0C9WGM2_9AGAR|nr:hypothetical protein K443DRAFT_666491 [Laccaria amethystina LaAM-08-1]